MEERKLREGSLLMGIRVDEEALKKNKKVFGYPMGVE